MSTPIDLIDQTLADLPRFLLVEETAKVLRVSRRTVARYIATGRIRVLKADDSGSCRVLVPRAELERYLRGLAFI
jgi:excisionase family DNA binding protein